MQPEIALLGHGNVGAALGATLARAGRRVVFGVRPGSDPAAALASCGPLARAETPATAVRAADLVFLALPGEAVVEVVRGLAGELAGRIVVDCCNPVAWDGGPVRAPLAQPSLAHAIAAVAPLARIVKGFNTFGAELHRDPNLRGSPVDVPLAADDLAALEEVEKVARAAGFRPLRAGPLRNAALLEAHALLWIHLALVGGLGRDFGFQAVTRV